MWDWVCWAALTVGQAGVIVWALAMAFILLASLWGWGVRAAISGDVATSEGLLSVNTGLRDLRADAGKSHKVLYEYAESLEERVAKLERRKR